MYDVIIIGAGKAGKTLAWTLPKSGKKVAVVERGLVGGTCINYGCIPTKAMVKSAHVAWQARHAAEFGVDVEGVRVDLARVQERRRGISAFMREGNEKSIVSSGCELLRGRARFTGPRAIEVVHDDGTSTALEGAIVVLDVGARPAVPTMPGIDTIEHLDSTSLMDVPSLPETLIILGGGYIGVEFAQMFARFGTRVTLVQRPKQLLPQEDEDVGAAVADALRADGVEVLLETGAVRVEKIDGGVRLWVSGERAIEGQHLMTAAGRVPETASLDLPAAGIETDEKGFIRVDERLQTSAHGVYAVGDCKGGPQFTHVSYDDFRVVLAQIEGRRERTVRGRLIPYGVFIEPQLGRVGMSEKEARAHNVDYRVAKLPMPKLFRARAVSEMDGFLKVLVDAKTDQILGATALMSDGAEIISLVQTAMLGKIPWTVLHEEAIYAHPTFAEALNLVFAGLQTP